MSIPFKINFFRQIEIFQEVLKLDKQFETMLKEWQENKKNGINRCYPVWEIQKKILLWTRKYHKYLGSPLKKEHFTNEESEERFLKDSYISKEEVENDTAGGAHSLEGLISMGLAESKDSGAVFNKDGLMWGELIDNLYDIVPEDTNSDFRKYKLSINQFRLVGYYLIYWATLLIILCSVLFLCLNLLAITNLLTILSSMFGFLSFLKQVISIIFILPAALYPISFLLIWIPIKK